MRQAQRRLLRQLGWVALEALGATLVAVIVAAFVFVIVYGSGLWVS